MTVHSTRMTVAMMQPTAMPWTGYFGLIHAADRFIFLDDFQLVKGSFHVRNRLLVDANRGGFYTTPVTKPRGHQTMLADAVVQQSADLQKQWRRLEANYSRTDYWEDLCEWVYQWWHATEIPLSTRNIEFIVWCAKLIGIESEFYRSSQLHTEGKRSARLVTLFNQLSGTTYLSPAGSRGYMEDESQYWRDIEVQFFCYAPPDLGAVVSDGPLSVLHYLFTVGADATRRLVLSGIQPPTPWVMAD